jgi:Flp pilus assembly protein CpaB
MIIGVIVIVVVLLVGVFFATRGSGGNKTALVPTPVVTSPVVVALQPITQGTTFQAGENLTTLFGIQNIPPAAVPFGAFTSLAQVQDTLGSASCGPVSVPGCRGVVAATQTIFQGEPVVTGMLAGLGAYRTTAGPAFQIPYGYVAIAVEISSVNAVENSIQPGDDVDLLASYIGGNEGGALKSKIPTQTQYVLNDLRVIGVGGPPAPPPPALAPTPVAGQPTPTPGAAQPAAAVAPTSGGTLVLLVRYQEALIVQHLKDFAASWNTSVVLRSSKETDIPHFRTVPVTGRWFFVKQSNHFDVTNPY